MENFFNYITKPLASDDVDTWLRINNIIPEKLELFSDFSHSLNFLILDTYLGENNYNNETKITLTENDNTAHFEWCWNKVIDNFNKENIEFYSEGEHYNYFLSFFNEVFYNQRDSTIRQTIGDFFKDLFNLDKSFTKSDLDMITTIYKLLDKHIKK